MDTDKTVKISEEAFKQLEKKAKKYRRNKKTILSMAIESYSEEKTWVSTGVTNS